MMRSVSDNNASDWDCSVSETSSLASGLGWRGNTSLHGLIQSMKRRGRSGLDTSQGSLHSTLFSSCSSIASISEEEERVEEELCDPGAEKPSHEELTSDTNNCHKPQALKRVEKGSVSCGSSALLSDAVTAGSPLEVTEVVAFTGKLGGSSGVEQRLGMKRRTRHSVPSFTMKTRGRAVADSSLLDHPQNSARSSSCTTVSSPTDNLVGSTKPSICSTKPSTRSTKPSTRSKKPSFSESLTDKQNDFLGTKPSRRLNSLTDKGKEKEETCAGKRKSERGAKGKKSEESVPIKKGRTAQSGGPAEEKQRKGASSLSENPAPGGAVGVTELWDWVIKPVPDCRGVCVEGQKSGVDGYWHSTAITEARSRRELRTVSGSLYQLKGKINKLCTLDNGFPKEVVVAFSHGFPKDWRDLVDKYYSSLEDSISVDMELLGGRAKKLLARRRSKAVAKGRSTEVNPLDQISILTAARVIKRESSPEDLTLTRSGRRSLPPLASWLGQTYSVVPGTNKVKVTFDTDTAERALTAETRHILRLPKWSQRSLLHKSLSRSLSALSPTSPSAGRLSTAPELTAGQVTPASSVSSKSNGKSRDSGISGVVELHANGQSVSSGRHGEGFQSPKHSSPRVAGPGSGSAHATPPGPLADGKTGRPSCSGKSRLGVTKRSLTQKKEWIGKKSCSKNSSSKESQSNCKESRGKKSHGKGSLGKESHDKKSCGKLPESHGKELCSEESPGTESQETRPSRNTSASKSKSKSKTSKTSKASLKAVGKAAGCDTGDKENVDVLSAGGETLNAPAADKSCPPNGSAGKRARRLAAVMAGDKFREIFTPSNPTRGKADVLPDHPVPGKKRTRREEKARPLDAAPAKGRREKKWDERAVGDGSGEADVGNVGRKRRKLDSSDGARARAWTGKDKTLVRHSVSQVSRDDPDYRDQVAAAVSPRSARQTQLFHQDNGQPTKKPSQAPRASAKKETAKGKRPTGGKGTLKRKQEVRSMLDAQNQDYEDNLFEGTPFASRRSHSAVTGIDFSKDDADVFGARHNFFTPLSSKDGTGTLSSPGTALKAKLSSAMKRATPGQLSAETPLSTNRHVADRYIKTFMERKKKPAVPVTQLNVVEEELRDSLLPVKALFSPVAVPAVLVEEDEPHDSYMYYWDEED